MPDNPPSEIRSLIGKHVDAFNTQNVELFLTVFSDDAMIIDGIAPYRWLNPNAPANGSPTSKNGAKPFRSRPSICRTKWGSGTWRAPMRTPSSRRR